MGTPKAALEWHGSTLLYRTAAIVARATGGPVVVVRARGQDLPELPKAVTVVDDPREGKGPVQGIAAGLAALAGHADAAFVTSTDLPFLHPAFLTALEDSGAVGHGTAWQPCHLLFLHDRRPVALLPLYRKLDSRGEYVFDHAWAAAYQRHGLADYPKLVTAIPFTPVRGPRLLLAEGESAATWLPEVLAAVQAECENQPASGWHGLFVETEWLPVAAQAGMAVREGCRFHWENAGYRDFGDFLDTLTSKKRKDLRRERRRLQESGINCRQLEGPDIEAATWDFFYACYTTTYHEHGQRPYLSADFFRQLGKRLRDRLLMVIAEDAAGPMASALFFHDGTTLYGRHWGCLRRADGLHFEVCYYQGMEICMRRGLRDFDPGTQGEHKLLRGFAPRLTHSLHWLREPGFRQAVMDFVREEGVAVRRYRDDAETLLPYRQKSGK